MNIKRKAKKFATMLQLIIGATVLTSCGKENDSISESTIFSDYEIDNSGISVFYTPTSEDGMIHVCDSKKETKMTEELYAKIKSEIEESTQEHSLNICLESTPIDFTNIDISNYNQITIDCPNINFNYLSFCNKYYKSFRIVISENTNKEDVINLIQSINITLKSTGPAGPRYPYLELEFTEEVTPTLINEYLQAIPNMKELVCLKIETSANINELNLINAKCNVLEVYHKTNEEIDYDITINDNINEFNLETHYSNTYVKDEVLFKNLKINSNNEELNIDYDVSRIPSDGEFLAKVDDNTIMTLPDNSVFKATGIYVGDVGDNWFKQFDNLAKVNFGDYFSYNSNEKTIEEAIEDMNFEIEGSEVYGMLEECGIEVKVDDDTLKFSLVNENDVSITNERIYDYLNAVIKKYNITRIKVKDLDKQIDFSKIDLTNITSTDLSNVGYNFDYAPFIADNTIKPPSGGLQIKVKKDNNHNSRLNYIKSIPLIDDAYVEISFFEDIDVNLATSYLKAIDYSKVSQLYIHYDKINELDFANISVSKLALYDSSSNHLINYNVNINEDVKDFTLAISYDKDYDVIPTIEHIEINSSNKNLWTRIFVYQYGDLLDTFNCEVSDSSIIKAPNESSLEINGVEENSISAPFLEQFESLRNFDILDSSKSYRYYFRNDKVSGTWHYEEKEQEKKLLKELDEK